MILFPNSGIGEAVKVLESANTAFSRQEIICNPQDQASQLSLSMGLSAFPTLAKAKEELIAQADSALYYAKSIGQGTIEPFREALRDFQKRLQMDRTLKDNLRNLLASVSDKNKYVLPHSERVADYAILIGRALNMTPEELFYLRVEALLHDIGIYKLPERVFHKPGPLTEDEFDLVKQHSTYSADLVQELPSMGNIVEDIRHHHERFDGRGYPDGVRELQIPVGARILAIADAFDAMLSDRPYRKAKSLQEALQELVRNAGTQFDPKLVKLFIEQFWKGEAWGM